MDEAGRALSEVGFILFAAACIAALVLLLRFLL